MPAFVIKRLDSFPSLAIDLLDERGDPVDASGLSAEFVLSTAALSGVDRECAPVQLAPGEFVFAKPAAIEPDGARVRYDWSPGDTAAAGRYLGEFKVIYPGARVRTFPPVGYLHINVIPDLSPASYVPPDPGTPTTFRRLLENGSARLLENGDHRLLEAN